MRMRATTFLGKIMGQDGSRDRSVCKKSTLVYSSHYMLKFANNRSLPDTLRPLCLLAGAKKKRHLFLSCLITIVQMPFHQFRQRSTYSQRLTFQSHFLLNLVHPLVMTTLARPLSLPGLPIERSNRIAEVQGQHLASAQGGPVQGK